MLLIIDNKIPRRIRGVRFSIGSGEDDAITFPDSEISPQECELYRAYQSTTEETWRLLNLRGAEITVSKGGKRELHSCGLHQEITLEPPFEIHLGRHVISTVTGHRDGGVAERLREAAFEIERSVQLQILNEVQFSPVSESASIERDRVEREMSSVLETMEAIPLETERYMAAQAVTQFLTDRIQGPRRPGQQSWRKDESEGFVSLLRRLEDGIRISEDRTAAEKLERVDLLLPWLVQNPAYAMPANECRELAEALIRMHLRDLIFGYGPLEDLLVSPDISDIMVLPSGRIFIEQSGRMQDSGRMMFSSKIANQVVEKIVAAENREINQTSPMVDARLSDGSRLNAIVEPLSIDGPALTIRRFPTKRMRLEELTALGSLTPGVQEFLIHSVAARKSIVISGGTGSGKTTLLNALSEFIPATERVITIEDTAEMNLAQPHVISLQSRPPNRSGKGEVTIYDLVRNSLRMRPDRIIVGECRGGEALDMLQAMNTGHEGSMTTIHANSPDDALRRLEVLAMSAKTVDLPLRAIRTQVGAAVDLLVQIGRLPSGGRKILSVCEVVGFDEDEDKLIVEEIFTNRMGRDSDGLPSDRLFFTGYVPTFFDFLVRMGATVGCFY
jgi:pilus assembly protein CpaF